MEKLSIFFVEHIFLCLSFIMVLIIYIFFELSESKKRKTNILNQDAIRLINKEKGIFIDVRKKEEFNEGHIVGSLNIPLENLELEMKNKSNKIHKDKPIVVYCENEALANVFYKKLSLLFKGNQDKKIYILDGGLKQWRKDNLPLSKV